MEKFTSKYGSQKTMRSVSLPPRSHPTTIKVEQIVNKLKTRGTQHLANSGVICNELRGLTELHEGIEELLAMQFTRQGIVENKHDARVNELLEDSEEFIDICSNTRDSITQIKQGVADVQSSFRRSKIDVSEYIDSSKNTQKNIARSLSMTEKRRPGSMSLSNRNQFHAILKVLIEANVVTMSVFRSLLQFLSLKVLKPRPNRWSLISKLMKRGNLQNEDQVQNNQINELEDVDLALGELLLDLVSCKEVEPEKIEVAELRLEALEATVEAMENQLDAVLRQLIRTRVSLLNIFSH